jgi:microcompartment protein CcmL/EutN
VLADDLVAVAVRGGEHVAKDVLHRVGEDTNLVLAKAFYQIYAHKRHAGHSSWSRSRVGTAETAAAWT